MLIPFALQSFSSSFSFSVSFRGVASSPIATCFKPAKKDRERGRERERERARFARERSSSDHWREGCALFSPTKKENDPSFCLSRWLSNRSRSRPRSRSRFLSVQRVFSHRQLALNLQRKTENEDDNENEHDLRGRANAPGWYPHSRLFSHLSRGLRL